jgi:outer membrane protein assembly factor BamB
MITIELGEVTSPGFEPAPGIDRRLVRRLAVVAVALATLLGVTGSERPRPDGVHPLWSVPMSEADGLILGSDAAYLNRTTDGRARLTAYDLATGAVRWEERLDNTTGEIQVAEPAGLVLLSADREAGTTDGVFVEYHRTTIALDARTGRRLWTTSGQIISIVAGTALMADHTDHGTIARLRMIRLADQNTVWLRDAGLFSYTLLPDRIVAATVDGRIDVLRLADGVRLAGARVRWVTPKPEDNQFNDLTAIAGHLVVTSHADSRADLTVYRLDTMAEVWRGRLTEGYAFPCGTVLCQFDNPDLTAYDPATGVRRWRRTGVDNAWVPTDHRVVVEQGAQLTMIDAATGEQIGDQVRTGNAVWTLDPGADVFLLNPTTSPANRTSIIRWDVTTGRSHLLGMVDQLIGYRCQQRGHYLACNRDLRLEVAAVA